MQCRGWLCSSESLFYLFTESYTNVFANTAACSAFSINNWETQRSTCCSSCRQSYYSLTCFFFSCTDSELGKRGVGPRLRHVRAEGTNCRWSPFCSPLIWEFNYQTQTSAGLRRTNSNIKTLSALKLRYTPSSSVYPMSPRPCRQTTAASVICYRVISLQ